MGLLDDAIREHLDLKRRRGADPTEVARLEQEALGPVRREPAPTEAAPAEAAQDAPADGAAEEKPAAAPEPAAVEAPREEPAEPSPPPPADPDPAEHPHVLAPEDRHEPPHGDQLLQPTTEYRVEDHHDEDTEPDAPPDDVLEETPDFLQETPEHDRLWFEQRPPRDFDFDG